MVRSLAWCEKIRVIFGTQLKIGPTILQGKSTIFGDDPTAKRGVKTIDEADAITGLVSNAKIDRVARALGPAGISVNRWIGAFSSGKQFSSLTKILWRY